MNAGDLDQKVEIQHETRVANGQGGYTTSWAMLANNGEPWANVIGLSGDEALLAGVQRAVQQWRVVIRRRDDVTAKNRLLWRGLVLNVKSVMPLPSKPGAFTLLICESGAVA